MLKVDCSPVIDKVELLFYAAESALTRFAQHRLTVLEVFCMADSLQEHLALLPESGVMPFEDYKSRVMSQIGRPLGNRIFVALKKRGNARLSFAPDGTVMIGRDTGS